MSGGVFVGRPDRTCMCGWKCPVKMNVRLPPGIGLGVGDLEYVCPDCGALIWEGGSSVPTPNAPGAPSLEVAPEVEKKEETPS